MGAKEIKIYQGDSILLSFNIVDEDGKMFDVTNYDVMKFMVKANKSDADTDALITKTKSDMTVVSAKRGEVTLQLDSDDTETVTVGLNYYELEIEYTGGKKKYTVLQDNFIVYENVVDVP